jgi:hypothetical protein
MITIKKHLTVNGKVETHNFRQFESLEDALMHISEEKLCIFLNSAILNHDRNQLRKHIIKGDEIEKALYRDKQHFTYL